MGPVLYQKHSDEDMTSSNSQASSIECDSDDGIDYVNELPLVFTVLILIGSLTVLILIGSLCVPGF